MANQYNSIADYEKYDFLKVKYSIMYGVLPKKLDSIVKYCGKIKNAKMEGIINLPVVVDVGNCRVSVAAEVVKVIKAALNGQEVSDLNETMKGMHYYTAVSKKIDCISDVTIFDSIQVSELNRWVFDLILKCYQEISKLNFFEHLNCNEICAILTKSEESFPGIYLRDLIDLGKNNDDVYQKTFEDIKFRMEVNGSGWSRPWNKLLANNIPLNAKTRRQYSGWNWLCLAAKTEFESYSHSLWATRKQWASLGAKIREDQSGFPVKRTVQKKGSYEDTFITVYSVLFNLEQVSFEVESTKIMLLKRFSCSEKIDLNSEARAIIEKIKCSKVVEITNCGGRAFYSRLNDSITLPEEHYFSDSGAYLSVLLHEIVHWSGAEKRLNRQKGKIFGDEYYAKEELVAELGAAFLSATLKISNTVNEDLRGDNHAAYLNSWLSRVDFNLRSLEPYANKAKKASDYILNEILMCKPSKLLG